MTAVALAVTFLVSAASKTALVDRAAVLAARGETAEARHLLERLVTSSNPRRCSLWRDHFARNMTDEVGYHELMSR